MDKKQIFIRANFKPDKNQWEFIFSDETYYLSPKVFSRLVEEISKLPIDVGSFSIEITEGTEISVIEIDSCQIVRLKDYLQMCESSFKESNYGSEL